jgi:hypothetical protein
MYDGGQNGARARSSRIRSAHDHEATTLDSMRRRSQALQEQPTRSRWQLVRVVLTLGRGRARRRELERETLVLSD